ncbi:hypothetical protein OJ253_3118 [Cryptosporidium canis]|uniref:Non-canonical E2 ubiquitin-conjugating enzyme C-terminal domain-containing protein n=1 Tax=Cryptosporidium canis TaxID=195482 RepID=A0A9D5DI39_9CRYT|nr:hypothetical protein OJ253_3118 [Cryptosporidium canis]
MTASERLKQILEDDVPESGFEKYIDLESLNRLDETGNYDAKNIRDSSLDILHALGQREIISILDRVLGGDNFEGVLEETAKEYLGDRWPISVTNKGENGFKSDSFSDICSSETDFITLSKNVPLRIDSNERQLLKLVEGTLEVSRYTDKVDIGSASRSKMIINEIKQVCAILSGLAVSFDYELGQRLIKDRCFSDNEKFFQTVFEIARRYKMLNPEMMRDSYGKLIFLLMDAQKENIKELLQFKCYKPVLTVYEFLKSRNCLDILNDPLLQVATRNIEQVDDINILNGKLTKKRLAIKELLRRYASRDFSEQDSKKSTSRGLYSLFMLGRSSQTQETEISSQSGVVTSTGSLENMEKTQDMKEITVEELEMCIYSLNDHDVFLYYNKRPIDKMIEYLTTFFNPQKEHSSELSLSLVRDPNSGARLSHDHTRQYYYVLQSLTMWREVLFNMIRLWRLAEDDLLDGNNGYRLGDTGQGIHRIQSAPRLYRAMCEIISKVQSEVGNWVGSSVIHLGDRTVPNALVFIDKYLQVPKILAPIVLCIENIDKLSNSNAHLRIFIENSFGGVLSLKQQILLDFFKHGFDGGGADNFFDAGSCIDGRLTSAWNWCSNIEKKPYFPIFLLTGFVGFDGKF